MSKHIAFVVVFKEESPKGEVLDHVRRTIEDSFTDWDEWVEENPILEVYVDEDYSD